MEYQKFLDCVIEQVKRLCKDGSVVSVNQIRKNNGLLLDGLVIQEKDKKISPAIYLNQYYEQYQSGRTVTDIVDEIYQTFLKYGGISVPDASKFMDLDYIQKRVVYKLVNYEKNQELLTSVPYVDFLDLALVFYVMLDWNECENASFLIHEEHLRLWNVTVEELYSYAEKNMQVLLPPCLRKLDEMLENMFDCDLNDEVVEQFPMYVLSNEKSWNGATVICYPKVLHSFSESLGGCNLYIIPSSIHEVLLIPDDRQVRVLDMEQTIREVNETQLVVEDVLSEYLYYYDYHRDCVMKYFER